MSARAALVERLEQSGTPKTTAEQYSDESNDQAFADAIKAQGATILGYSLGTLAANGRTKGEIEQGFTTEMILPAPLSYNLARIPPGMVRELYDSKCVSARRSRFSTRPRTAPVSCPSIPMTTESCAR